MNPMQRSWEGQGPGHGRGDRRSRPLLETLEGRIALTGNAALFSALTDPHFHWVDYAPSYDKPTDPYNANPSAERITADLTVLYQEGFRGVVTYTLLGSYDSIPRIAKSIGFQYVIAGIYTPTNTTELNAASSPQVLPYADGFVVGNEGLQDGRYSYDQLSTAIAQVQKATLKPTTTSEPGGQYYTGSPHSADLLGLGDWLFPNTDYFLWNGQPSTPQAMWTNVSFFYQFALGHNTTAGPVVVKECFYPTDGGAGASEQNQYDWYKIAYDAALGGQFDFVWGEAFDQPWKTTPTAYEPHMGLHGLNNPNGTANPKKVIDLIDGRPKIQFARSDVSVIEGRAAAITVTRTGDASQPSTVKLVVADSSTASSSDHAALPDGGVVRFRAGERAKTIQLRTIDDRASEASETLVLTLRDPSGAGLGSTVTDTVTIRDNDPPAHRGLIQFTTGAATVAEGRSVRLTLTRTGGTSALATVRVLVGASGTASATDYLPLRGNGLVTFPVGTSRRTIRLTTVDDRLLDPRETVILQLHDPTGAALGPTIQKTVRIRDNDPPRRLFGTHAADRHRAHRFARSSRLVSIETRFSHRCSRKFESIRDTLDHPAGASSPGR